MEKHTYKTVVELPTVKVEFFSVKSPDLAFPLQVGALNACFLAKRGFNVDVFEAREGRVQSHFTNLTMRDRVTLPLPIHALQL